VNLAISTLQTHVAALQTSNALVQALIPFVSVDPNPINDLTGPHILFTGANVHVRSGAGSTDEGVGVGGTPTGLGNLIVGYNEQLPSPVPRTGSNNLIVGPFHEFSSVGGFVAGRRNTIGNMSASVSGGQINTASGFAASVSGGGPNTASGNFASVSGGGGNTASGDLASVSGGGSNTAGGQVSTVSGGISHSTVGFGEHVP